MCLPPLSHSPILPLSHSLSHPHSPTPTLPLSHSPTLPLQYFIATMSSNADFTTPEKKRRPSSQSPPAAPARKRLKDTFASTEDSLLLLTINDVGQIVTYSSNHIVLSEIKGHHNDVEFLSDELFESVLGIVGGDGYSSVNRDLYVEEEILELKQKALLKLFTQEIYGGGEASEGEMFRGTIVI